MWHVVVFHRQYKGREWSSSAAYVRSSHDTPEAARHEADRIEEASTAIARRLDESDTPAQEAETDELLTLLPVDVQVWTDDELHEQSASVPRAEHPAPRVKGRGRAPRRFPI